MSFVVNGTEIPEVKGNIVINGIYIEKIDVVDGNTTVTVWRTNKEGEWEIWIDPNNGFLNVSKTESPLYVEGSSTALNAMGKGGIISTKYHDLTGFTRLTFDCEEIYCGIRGDNNCWTYLQVVNTSNVVVAQVICDAGNGLIDEGWGNYRITNKKYSIDVSSLSGEHKIRVMIQNIGGGNYGWAGTHHCKFNKIYFSNPYVAYRYNEGWNVTPSSIVETGVDTSNYYSGYSHSYTNNTGEAITLKARRGNATAYGGCQVALYGIPRRGCTKISIHVYSNHNGGARLVDNNGNEISGTFKELNGGTGYLDISIPDSIGDVVNIQLTLSVAVAETEGVASFYAIEFLE